MLIIRLCRFDGQGHLSYHEVDIFTHSFVAISHLWTDKTDWVRIPGIPNRVKSSTQKAKFIEQRLPGLVGGKLFWMDILAIDQADKAAVSAIVRYIPDIYRNAEKTIVVREGGGFGACCLDMVPQRRQLTTYADTYLAHLSAYHPEGFEEQWLSRVWVYQEAMLSDTLQFVICEAKGNVGGVTSTEGKSRKLSGTNSATNIQYPVVMRFVTQLNQIPVIGSEWFRDDALSFTARDSNFGSKSNTEAEEEFSLWFNERMNAFWEAFFLGGLISRKFGTRRRPPRENSTVYDSVIHDLSNYTFNDRFASKPQDLILATFPSCRWYSTPVNTRNLTVVELWIDAVHQMLKYQAALHEESRQGGLLPRITVGMVNANCGLQTAHEPTSNVPIPETMGDLSRLFVAQENSTRHPLLTKITLLNRLVHNPIFNISLKSTNTSWKLEAVDDTSMLGVLKIISGTLFSSRANVINLQDLQSGLEHADGIGSSLDCSRYFQEWESRKAGKGEGTTAETLTLALDILLALAELAATLSIDLSEKRADRRPRAYDRWWLQIVSIAAFYDSPFLRALLLQLTALSVCNFRVKNLGWSISNLQPCVLVPSLGNLTWGMPRYLTLVAKNLVITPKISVSVSGGYSGQYLCIRSLENSAEDPRPTEPRIVGMLPLWVDLKWEGGFVIFVDAGCPVAVPLAHEDASVEPGEYLKLCSEFHKFGRESFIADRASVIYPWPNPFKLHWYVVLLRRFIYDISYILFVIGILAGIVIRLMF